MAQRGDLKLDQAGGLFVLRRGKRLIEMSEVEARWLQSAALPAELPRLKSGAEIMNDRVGSRPPEPKEN